ncbi:VanZ family protein [Faecalibacterium sp. PGM34]
MEYVKQIIQDILTMLYQYLGISIICSVLIILVWKQAEENSWKSIWVRLKTLLQNQRWRKRFFFVLYIVFVLQRTIFNRGPWGNPLGNVVGNWWLVQNGSPNYEMFENILLFVPLYPFVKTCETEHRAKWIERCGCWDVIVVPFVCSFAIEMVQLLFRVGTWQLSDLFYNTLGGVIGSLIYYIGYKIKHRGKMI